MKQVESISIAEDITPTEGIGDIKLGMNSFYLRGFYKSTFFDSKGVYSPTSSKNNWESELSIPFFQFVGITYKDFLTIGINLFSGEISHLSVKESYKGKVLGIVGIGDSVRPFYSEYEKEFYEFEDGWFFFWMDANKRYGLSFLIDEDLEDYPPNDLFEQYLDMPIKEIEIFDNHQMITIGGELPDKWK